ncbi:hypothetical protein AJ79_06849 [Helicocarpus griseus UAMH5409]|uniref:Uncharacterized protein n=1 Tax=Helicocarpus griseus UAMH5409 TaxID=1447875 RepID=A0A2B7X9B4_9EURO|nr:hypothetical protein AJ79_06849 [Helicocarpus griseus UAMH5409]
MDCVTAREILKVTLLREFPFAYILGSQCALIKSVEDTAVFFAEFFISGIDSPRGLAAVSKMNSDHRRYGSKISNDELLFTLALLILEPPRLIDTYEWRKLTMIERVAMFTYWKEIGNRMGIRNIPNDIDALANWNKTFEAEHMRYADTNRLCAMSTVNTFVRNWPSCTKELGKDMIACFLQRYVRPLIGLEEPSRAMLLGVALFFKFRAFAIRHLFLPRFHDVESSTERDGGKKKIQRKVYLFEPWYVAETAWSSAIKRILGGVFPLPGPEYLSEGYLPEELGPIEYNEQSKGAVLKEAEQMKEYASNGGGSQLGCPFSFSG